MLTITPGYIPPLPKEHEIETRKATEAIREFVKAERANDKKAGKCLFCPTIGLQESHVIKGETIRSIAGGRKLLTPFSRNQDVFSILTEDQQEIPASKAFTFILICNRCDGKFSYEDKAKVKRRYDSEDLKAIALKIRLKELYDHFERLHISRFIPTNEVETILQALMGSRKQINSSVIDEQNEVQKIRKNVRNYRIFSDGFLNYRIPFALESFIAPKLFPKTKDIVRNNLYGGNEDGEYKDMSAFYVLMQPSSQKDDNWSRLTVFFDENDDSMVRWFEEFSHVNRSDTEKLANAMISHHLNVSAKNFVMSHDIDRNFLTKVRRARLEFRSSEPNIQYNWMKMLREKKK